MILFTTPQNGRWVTSQVGSVLAQGGGDLLELLDESLDVVEVGIAGVCRIERDEVEFAELDAHRAGRTWMGNGCALERQGRRLGPGT